MSNKIIDDIDLDHTFISDEIQKIYYDDELEREIVTRIEEEEQQCDDFICDKCDFCELKCGNEALLHVVSGELVPQFDDFVKIGLATQSCNNRCEMCNSILDALTSN